VHAHCSTVRSPEADRIHIEAKARRVFAAAIARTTLRTMLDEMPDDALAVVRDAADELDVRREAHDLLRERANAIRQCASCKRLADPGSDHCAMCAWEIEEATILAGRGIEMAAIVTMQNGRHEVTA